MRTAFWSGPYLRVADAPAFALAADVAPITVNAYVGTPIVAPDGELFGTVCGIDPRPQPDRPELGQPLGGDEFGIVAIGATGEQASSWSTGWGVPWPRPGWRDRSGTRPTASPRASPGAVAAADRAMYAQKRARRAGTDRTPLARAARHRRGDER